MRVILCELFRVCHDSGVKALFFFFWFQTMTGTSVNNNVKVRFTLPHSESFVIIAL